MRLVTFGGTGDLPFQLYPALGGAYLFRGWFLGRLRDRVLLAGEAEYRVPLSTRWALVAFGALGRVLRRSGCGLKTSARVADTPSACLQLKVADARIRHRPAGNRVPLVAVELLGIPANERSICLRGT